MKVVALLILGVLPYLAGPEVRLRVRPNPYKRIWIRGNLPPPIPSIEKEPFMFVDPRMVTRPATGADFTLQGPTPPVPWLKGMRYPDIPVVFDESVMEYLKWFRYSTTGRAVARALIAASGRYRALILDTLRRHRLPTALLYVAMAESGFRPTIKSWAGAAGLWQLLESGADTYGLTVNHWVDERLSPELSTEAAAYYFEDLIHRFGRWELALAAYNCGYGRVLQSMRRYGTNDYWKMRRYENALPQETRLYVPKIIALAIVDLNRKKFGLDGVTLAEPYAFDSLYVPGGLSLRAIEKRAGLKEGSLQELNPEYIRGRLPPGRTPVLLRVPVGSASRVRRAVERVRKWWKGYTVHVLSLGETLEDVARAYGTTRKALRKLNSIRAESDLAIGTPLIVPRRALRVPPSPKDGERPFVAVPRGFRVPSGYRLYFYKTTRYDTVEGISAALGIPAMKLREWNDLVPGAKLTSSMYLMVLVPRDTTPHRALIAASECDVVEVDSEEFHAFYLDKVDKVRIVHVVRKGETLRSLARRYGTKARWIRNLNRLKSSDLTPGMRLVIYAKKSKVRRTRRKRTSEGAKVAKDGGAKAAAGGKGGSPTSPRKAGASKDTKKRGNGTRAGGAPVKERSKGGKDGKGTAPSARPAPTPVAPSASAVVDGTDQNAWTGGMR